ncbi:MAG: glycosyl/glycerophosphate transferase [Microbacterium sp. SCN 70-27]|uniref:CDP-glycerol glycerophosphotransferase family protein n=1 Tax=unclassified Microbacterium TaxID=2609290 RepID=UPI00086A23E9|nr:MULTISPECIES: CDP-glycerol glycerophosphotransferase family protein [unclassified Microbacterium]MBN9223620.1 CDP-glycerol glycerophosphotransferase family protein [Microbacterium sp.]ODT28169.1 MAG: glycosyl/glycerophosphate transferase [Microbacterium sp. SCN 70-27]
MTITARLDDDAVPTLVLSGKGARPQRVTLTGRRAEIAARLAGRGATWTARLPLEAARWGRPALPLPSGEYTLRIVDADGAEGSVDASAPALLTATMRAELVSGTLDVRPPLDPAYETGEGQSALERRYATRPRGLENAVFFESFYGRNAGCNPRAIDRELARVAPNVTRYWSVVDLSVAVPDGAIPVVEGTPQWWRARGSARLLVVNDWLRRRYARRSGQVVLQTWHGTPLKRLALHRPGFDPRRMLAVLRESRRWDVLLAQNPYGERILRKAYAFLRRPVWVEGYPRNDVLTTGDGAATRAALGIAPGERVILYAPTWRDDRDEIVDFLDLARLAADTGAVILVRGHSRTILPGSDAHGERVIDVTAYPDIAELLVVADALVTDYSSAMFDYTATGKPIVFFTPDLEHYREQLRGFYFDLAAYAPGPMVSTQDALTEALAAETVPAEYAERYATWRQRFNARDDGHASERVVARILDQGFVERG